MAGTSPATTPEVDIDNDVASSASTPFAVRALESGSVVPCANARRHLRRDYVEFHRNPWPGYSKARALLKARSSTNGGSRDSATSTRAKPCFAPGCCRYALPAFWPMRPASPRPAARALAKAIRAVLEEAIEAGGPTLRDHCRADGELGYLQHTFAVYDREGLRCLRPRCSGAIARVAHSGRSTFYCPRCQK